MKRTWYCYFFYKVGEIQTERFQAEIWAIRSFQDMLLNEYKWGLEYINPTVWKFDLYFRDQHYTLFINEKDNIRHTWTQTHTYTRLYIMALIFSEQRKVIILELELGFEFSDALASYFTSCAISVPYNKFWVCLPFFNRCFYVHEDYKCIKQ